MFLKIDKELSCILSLSFCFMLLFAADLTMVNMQKIVLSSIGDERPDFHVDGYTVIGFTYTVFAISLWFGPYINHALGSKLTMITAAFGYLYYVASYITEEALMIYLAAAVTGVAAGILWPAQGHYLIGNSSVETTSRNVGIFCFIFMSSNMLGNIFVYFSFHGKKYLDQTTRRTAVSFLVAINTVAIIAFLLLPKPINDLKPTVNGPIKSIKKSWNILTSSRMLWLTLTFIYAGLQQSFWNGIYSPSIGFTLAFGDSAKELVALSGISMSIGSVLGALCPIVLSNWIRGQRYARRMIVLTGIIAQFFTYLIGFINLPNSSVFGNTEEESLIHPSAPLALLGSLLLTFGDSCITTQVYSFFGDYYRETSAEASALYKFVKGITVAISFFWCKLLGLHTQIAIATVVAVIGLVAFFIADHDNISRPGAMKKSKTQCPENLEISEKK